MRKLKADDFVEMLATEIDSPYVDTRNFLRGFRRCVRRALESGGKVMLYGVGTLKLHRYGERKNYDLNAGEVVTLPPVTRIVFTPSPVLRKKVEEIIPPDYVDGEEMEEEGMDAED